MHDDILFFKSNGRSNSGFAIPMNLCLSTGSLCHYMGSIQGGVEKVYKIIKNVVIRACATPKHAKRNLTPIMKKQSYANFKKWDPVTCF